MNRRTFSRNLYLAALGLCVAPALLLTGCSAVTDLENFIPVALTSVSAIVKLLGPVVPPQVAAVIVVIQAGFSALLATLKSYQSGGSPLADVSNAIAAAEASFASFFASLNVSSTLLNTIEGLAGIIISTIQGFAA